MHPAFTRKVVALTVTVALIGAVGIAVATAWTVSVAAGSKAQAQAPSATPVPTGVTATCVSSTQTTVTVTWTAETGAQTYTVYDSTTSATGPWTSLGPVTAPTVTYTSGSLTPAGGYYFAVTTTLSDAAWGASTQSTASAKRTIGAASCA
jgi:hypothetical protein